MQIATKTESHPAHGLFLKQRRRIWLFSTSTKHPLILVLIYPWMSVKHMLGSFWSGSLRKGAYQLRNYSEAITTYYEDGPLPAV